jgi:hypothetical protein
MIEFRRPSHITPIAVGDRDTTFIVSRLPDRSSFCRFTLQSDIHPRDPNGREGRANPACLTSATDNAALEFGRRT